MKLGIGTAQFGLDYGISNKEGQTSLGEVRKTFDYAYKNSIKIIDTAYLYGNSEEIIGLCLNNHENNFKIVTKTVKTSNPNELESAFLASLNKLNQESVYGLMFHDADNLIDDNGSLWKKMTEFKNKGLVDKIGVSVYSGKQIDIILNKTEIDIIQVPVNVFDQRLIQNDYLRKLKDKNIEIHARSPFLQGLLLMNQKEIPDYFTEIKNHIEKYQKTLTANKISLLEGALSFVKNINEIDFIICGINNCNQLNEIIKAYNKTHNIDLSKFAINDEKFVNPTKWLIN